MGADLPLEAPFLTWGWGEGHSDLPSGGGQLSGTGGLSGRLSPVLGPLAHQKGCCLARRASVPPFSLTLEVPMEVLPELVHVADVHHSVCCVLIGC